MYKQKDVKFKCPKCLEYVLFVGELIPLGEELELFCNNCGEETAILKLSPMPTVIHHAPPAPWKPE